MIMKHISIVLLAGLAAVAFACTKETPPEQTAPEPQEMGVGGGDIVCIDGTLHFSSGEVCLNTLESLTSEESLHAFEKAHISPRGVRSRMVCWMILSPVKLRRSTKRFLKPAQVILKWIMTA